MHLCLVAAQTLLIQPVPLIGRCGWNSAVQLLAGFPGILKYLEWACGVCPHSLQLHQGLRNQLTQLRDLKGTDAVSSVAGLLSTVHTAAKKGNLKEMSSRQEG